MSHSQSQKKPREARITSVSSKVVCKSCKVEVQQSGDSIECELCLGWYHSGCVGITGKKIDFLSIAGIHWFCSSCDITSVQVSFLTKEVKKIRAAIEKSKDEANSFYSLCPFDDRIKNLEAGLKDINTTLTKYVSAPESKGLEPRLEAMEKSYAAAVKNLEVHSTIIASAVEKTRIQTEQDQKVTRDKNLIIFGVSENATKQETLDKVQQLVKNCHLSMEIKMQDMHRLGKFENIKTDKNGLKIPRPIKLCIDSKERKWDILKRINALRVKGIFAKPDLTHEEREADFQLRTELKKIREENPGHAYKIKNNKVIQINSPTTTS